jgi:hypothetical protein
MSNLSQFSGGGGGGGETHIVTDPRKLPKMATANCYIKTGTTTEIVSTNQAFFSERIILSHHTSSVQCASNDAYVTLLDITGSNGGYLNWVISPQIHTIGNNISTVKITVDGSDPVELKYQASNIVGTPSGNRARMIIGGGWSSSRHNTSQNNTYGSVGFLNSYNANRFTFTGESIYSVINYDDPVNNVYGNSYYEMWLHNALDATDQATFPKLAFNTSLKVEVKQLTIDTGDAGQWSACSYTLH